MDSKDWFRKIWDRKKEIDIEGTQISAGFIEEERIYAGVMIYYNISDLIITKEIAQKFVPIKKNTIILWLSQGVNLNIR